MSKRAVLLVNLGSPDSTRVADVRRYLREFLGDERVIDKPAQPFRWLLVNGIITTFRAPKSAQAYKQIWTKSGSPLVVTSESVQKKLVDAFQSDEGGDAPLVFLAMRYGRPSIASVMETIVKAGVEELLLFPQYPHYAMSSWETVVVKVYEEAARLAAQATQDNPNAKRLRIDCVRPFYQDHDYISALYEVSKPHLENPCDHVLFSYHGIPERHLRKADSSKAHCLVVPDCCNTCSPIQETCYRSQITKTTQAFVRHAGIPDGKWSISFQSRLAGEPWLSPYTDEKLKQLPAEGKKRIVVLTPAFVADCLETLEEIAGEGRELFLHAGGESFTHVPCLNDSPAYIRFIKERVRCWLAGETPTATHLRQSAREVAPCCPK